MRGRQAVRPLSWHAEGKTASRNHIRCGWPLGPTSRCAPIGQHACARIVGIGVHPLACALVLGHMCQCPRAVGIGVVCPCAPLAVCGHLVGAHHSCWCTTSHCTAECSGGGLGDVHVNLCGCHRSSRKTVARHKFLALVKSCVCLVAPQVVPMHVRMSKQTMCTSSALGGFVDAPQVVPGWSLNVVGRAGPLNGAPTGRAGPLNGAPMGCQGSLLGFMPVGICSLAPVSKPGLTYGVCKPRLTYTGGHGPCMPFGRARRCWKPRTVRASPSGVHVGAGSSVCKTFGRPSWWWARSVQALRACT